MSTKSSYKPKRHPVPVKLEVDGLIKRERARRASEQRGISIQSCQIPPIFSEMAGLIRSGIYTGNDQYVGEKDKFVKFF